MTGPGFRTPLDAFKLGEREKLLYVICISPNVENNNKYPDYLSTIDVNEDSPRYGQIIHRTYMPYTSDELHHFGWNTCSSCYNDPTKNRDKLILPALGSNRIYVLSIDDPEVPTIHTVIQAEEVEKFNISAMHTTHCLPSGEVMISGMGDSKDNPKGDFILIDGETFTVKGTWTKGENKAKFGYDFWYQPYWDVLIASEWGAPSSFKKGFIVEDTLNPELYGQSLNIYSWKDRTLLQTIDLGEDGKAPLEIRFLHNPLAAEGFVGCGIGSNIFRFYRKEDNTWAAEKVIEIPAKKVKGWVVPELRSTISDILLSMDDKYLFFSNWLHGDIRQYDITDTAHPKLVGQLFLGGKLIKDQNLEIIEDPENQGEIKPIFVKGRRLYGGPQMMQLSLDGKRLYVTSSLYSTWDKQIYPDLVRYGSTLVKVHVDTVNGGLKLDPDFLIDFGNEPNGPCLAHEIRYPGGDCTSDIFLTEGCCSKGSKK